MSDLHPLLSELIGSPGGSAAVQSHAVGALAYVRVSTDMQEDKGLSVPAQRKAIEEYAAAHDVPILDTYTEAASSYQDEAKRVEFQRMFERAKADPQVGMVLVHESSRFCRHPWRTPQLIGELQDAGVRVVSVTEPEYDINTVMGMWMQKVMEAKNASYSMEVAFHTRKGMRQNANARDPKTNWCYKNGGRPAWGFRTVRTESTDLRGRPRFKATWELNAEEVAGRPVWEWTREVLVRAGEGASLDSLRDRLNEAGVPSPSGRYWSTSTLHSLLEPHMLLQYAGYGTWAVRKKRRRRWNSPEDWEVVPNAHPAIISEEQAKAIGQSRDKARERYAHRSARMAEVRSSGSRFILSGGIFRCSRCGANMAGHSDRGYDYYICGASFYRRGQGCGRAVYVPKDLVENKVWELAQEWLDQLRGTRGGSLLRQVNADLQQSWVGTGGQKAAMDQQRLVQVAKSMAALRSALEKGVDDIDWVNQRLRELRQEEEALRRAGSGGPFSDPPRVDAETVQRYAANLPSLLVHATSEEKRVLARALVTGITSDPETMEIGIGLTAPLFPPTCGGGGRSRTGE